MRSKAASFAAGSMIALAAVLAGGCSAFPAGDEAQDARGPAFDDTLRPAPSAAPAPAAANKKGPFWAKWRDERVEQINRNLNVHEPPGW